MAPQWRECTAARLPRSTLIQVDQGQHVYVRRRTPIRRNRWLRGELKPLAVKYETTASGTNGLSLPATKVFYCITSPGSVETSTISPGRDSVRGVGHRCGHGRWSVREGGAFLWRRCQRF
jgi:hypothetical protein